MFIQHMYSLADCNKLTIIHFLITFHTCCLEATCHVISNQWRPSIHVIVCNRSLEAFKVNRLRSISLKRDTKMTLKQLNIGRGGVDHRQVLLSAILPDACAVRFSW